MSDFFYLGIEYSVLIRPIYINKIKDEFYALVKKTIQSYFQ
jgi:hypothetical protein